MKCGEEKPHCRRCVTFGTICDGYGHLYRQTQAAQPKCKLIRPIQPKDSSQLIRNPFKTLFQHGKESWYFDNFCSKTSYEIFPDFGSGTLRRMLLQASQEEVSIRHAVVALGALDVTNEGVPALSGSIASQSRHHLDALEQYTIALKHMKVRASGLKYEG